MKATFMCHECKKIFQSGSELYKQVLTHGKPTLSCDKCNKTFRLSKLFNRHLMSVHGRVDGLKCNFEQCSVACQRLSEIKEHIREAHSVKDFVFGNHFSDAHNSKHMLGDDMFDDKEIDLAHIYEGLDIQIDNDVLGKSANEKLKIKIEMCKRTTPNSLSQM